MRVSILIYFIVGDEKQRYLMTPEEYKEANLEEQRGEELKNSLEDFINENIAREATVGKYQIIEDMDEYEDFKHRLLNDFNKVEQPQKDDPVSRSKERNRS